MNDHAIPGRTVESPRPVLDAGGDQNPPFSVPPATRWAGFGPVAVPDPPDPGRALESRTTTSPHEGLGRATSVGRNTISEPTASDLEEAATAGQLGGVPAVASERLQPCCAAMPPEHFDECRLVAKLTDRNGSRYISALGARREHPVRCSLCHAPAVMANDGLCDRCAIAAGARALTHLDIPAREALLQ